MLNLKALLEGDDFSHLQGVTAEAMRRAKERSDERLSEALVGALGFAENALYGQVSNVKARKRQLNQAKDQLSKVDRAVKYLQQTGNPLPLYEFTGDRMLAVAFCNQVGVSVPPTGDDLWNVPKDWQPKTE